MISKGRTRRRWVWLFAAITGCLCFLGVLAYLGKWLVVEDELQPAQAIVVLGGYIPYRPIEAAELYRQKWAPEVWLTRAQPTPEEELLKQLDVGYVPESELSRRVLLRWGLVPDAITTLATPVANTADEVRAILTQTASRPKGRVIVVTSKNHTRRVRMIWRWLGGEDSILIVRYSRKDPFDPSRWWSNSKDVLSTAREVGGIVNGWLGFPLQPERQ